MPRQPCTFAKKMKVSSSHIVCDMEGLYLWPFWIFHSVVKTWSVWSDSGLPCMTFVGSLILQFFFSALECKFSIFFQYRSPHTRYLSCPPHKTVWEKEFRSLGKYLNACCTALRYENLSMPPLPLFHEAFGNNCLAQPDVNKWEVFHLV